MIQMKFFRSRKVKNRPKPSLSSVVFCTNALGAEPEKGGELTLVAALAFSSPKSGVPEFGNRT